MTFEFEFEFEFMAFLKDLGVFVLGLVLGALVNVALVSAGAEWRPLPDGLPS